jgi:hypothetical protein
MTFIGKGGSLSGEGELGERCRDVACYVWEMRKMREIEESCSRRDYRSICL